MTNINIFKQKEKRIFLCVSSWSVSRVLSLKAIINLDAILLLHSSGHGNKRAVYMFHTLHLTEFTANYCHQYFEWALTSLFHHCPKAVYFCCTFPQVTLAWRYQAWLLCGARTFLTQNVRNCPTNYKYYIIFIKCCQSIYFVENFINITILCTIYKNAYYINNCLNNI